MKQAAKRHADQPPAADDREPRDQLVDHLPALRAFALSLTREGASADDLVQDTIVKAWTNMDKFQAGTNLRAWLFTILRNTFYSARRKTKREVADTDGIHASRQATRPDHDGRLALKDFRAAFEQLPDEQREALILVGASGFSYEQAAEMTGVAVGTVKSRANRGRRKLAELLDLSGADDLDMTDQATLAVMSASQTVMR
ncbi:RNA polymerase sigma factor [Paracoccus siganidrum]|uniref:RNA polymerase sigma factor n=1 Tax=Paracoccus siganidrum TaxID=1276757 RepID=A0A419ABV4_9RHOB|nr:RNA polymerase sigma factor [Paracoccus siganidrum]RJL21310.1 RNA polymerase sigma factor [Paracoccus siganidrum]RMC37044.1 RNA polymerase subunit sigma [Paracoccus siganidrum]